MKADILKPGAPTVPNGAGGYTYVQDPDSGALVRKWVDDPATPETEGSVVSIDCEAQSVIDGGIRVAGTTERFSDIYENVDWVQMTVSAKVNITKRDRVTNIRSKRGGNLVYAEEETGDGTAATVFEVRGVAPVTDPFGRVIEWFCLLERAEVQ